MRPIRRSHPLAFTLAGFATLTAAALVVACTSDPASPAMLAGVVAPSLAKPVSCNASVNLSIVMRDAAGDAITSDGGAYQENVDGVAAHLSGVNGNLLLSVSGTSRRFGYSTTAGSGLSDDRLYTNTHSNTGGNDACGLYGMAPAPSTGWAVFEAELRSGIGEDVIRYGKGCDGAIVTATRATTTHPTDDTWTITGASGVVCRPKSRGNGYNQVGTSGVFEISLLRVP